MLTFVPTPIGNLKDITLRALDVLKDADVIYCEDKRQSAKLLNHFGISTPLESYHEHNAEKVRPHILQKLQTGAHLAIITDAGMPVISDPGYKLVRMCQDNELDYTILPGPSAVLTALVASGFEPDRFIFGGFLPTKKGDRQRMLQEFALIPATRIFFESPRRLLATLEAIAEVMPTCQVAVCRELTKLYEEVQKAAPQDLIAHYQAHPPKGEIVVVVEGETPKKEFDLEQELRDALREHKTKEAASLVSQKTGHPKKELYTLALRLQAEAKA